jgi:hypothetical protein
MPQDNSGPANTLLTIPRFLGRMANRFDPPTAARVDPSWHADKVQEANRSFQQRADAERAAAAAASAPAPNTVKRVAKRTPARPAAKRR